MERYPNGRLNTQDKGGLGLKIYREGSSIIILPKSDFFMAWVYPKRSIRGR